MHPAPPPSAGETGGFREERSRTDVLQKFIGHRATPAGKQQMNAANHLVADEDGSQVIEYSVLIAALSIALTVSMTALQPPLCTLVGQVSNMMGMSAGNACTPSQGHPGRGGANSGRGDGNGNGNGNGNNGKGNGDTNGNGLGVQ
jgi:Flp pilus assembly pilin Flp